MHVLLSSTLSYMFRRLLRHLQGELYCKLITIVTLFNFMFSVVFYMRLQLDLQLFKKCDSNLVYTINFSLQMAQ